jgi:hypothetical protein
MYDLDYFKKEEFECKCGCGLSNPSPVLVKMLNITRYFANMKIKINSGTRCEEHNRQEGGSETSSHLIKASAYSSAVDIGCRDAMERGKLLPALIKAGFRRIGIGDTFIHADIDPRKNTPRMWTY